MSYSYISMSIYVYVIVCVMLCLCHMGYNKMSSQQYPYVKKMFSEFKFCFFANGKFGKFKFRLSLDFSKYLNDH